MSGNTKACKERSWAKKKANASMIPCGCGCGEQLLEVDDYGRKRTYISGHNGRKYEDPSEYRKAWVRRNRGKVNVARTARNRKFKVVLLTEFTNGTCIECGLKYNGKNGAVFQFHHRDPSEKETSISYGMANASKAKVLEEIKKCDLMCGHCHTILHQGEF